LVFLVLVLVAAWLTFLTPTAWWGPTIVHATYFRLKDKSPEAKQKLIAACKKYLAKHRGAVSFAVGTLGEEFTSDVSDRDWDVGLHLVFDSKADYDKYQDDARRKQFIAENQDVTAAGLPLPAP